MGQIVDRPVAKYHPVSGSVARPAADAPHPQANCNDDTGAPPSVLGVPGAVGTVEGKPMAHNCALISDLKGRRTALGLSINELGNRCGIDEKFLSDWEHGQSSPRLDAVQHWAAALGLTITLLPAEKSARRNGLVVDWERRCISVDGTPIRLTPMEWKALERLARTPGELVTHQDLFRYLYGDDRHHRAQSTAVRVLITKLRRLLPVRIEAQWGQGYVISGLAPSSPASSNGSIPGGNGNGGSSTGHGGLGGGQTGTSNPISRRPAVIAERPAERITLAPRPISTTPPPPRREIDLGQPPSRPAGGAAIRLGPHRAEELSVIERFLAERGVTRCPDVASIQQAPLPTLVWDKMKRKWVRPTADLQEAR